MEPERKSNRKLRSHALLAFHLNNAVHHVHNILRYGHPQSGSLDSAHGGIFFPLKRFENMGHKLFAHADAIVLDGKFKIGIPGRRPGLFRDPETDNASGTCIFHRIA